MILIQGIQANLRLLAVCYLRYTRRKVNETWGRMTENETTVTLERLKVNIEASPLSLKLH